MSLPASPRCVITGAASGFGRALALVLAPRGANLVLSDIDVPACQETARLCDMAGAKGTFAMRVDVTQLGDVQALAAASNGPIDLVVNNAGISAGGSIGELSIETWRATIAVDLWGVIHGCHVFTPILRRQGHGHVLNMASAAGLLCAPGMGPYNVAKAGVVALSETLSGELLGTGVGVTVLCPTFFKSDIVKSGRFLDEASRKAAQKLVDAGKDVHEIARLALADIERGALYSLPMADARWLWRIKRAAPTAFYKILLARLAKRAEARLND